MSTSQNSALGAVVSIIGAIGFLIATAALLWLTHALAFFAHEYAHSFAAWALGWKADPWIINFGHPDAINFLMMIEMDEKVDYARIFAGGDGAQAAVIAASGVVIGNGLLFVLSQALFAAAVQASLRWLSMFFYWLCVMCVGNFISYVPMRTFAPVGDMGIIQKALDVSPWMILIVLGAPFAIGLWFLFSHILPNLLTNVLIGTFERTVVVVLTSFVVFFFYGSAGWEPEFNAICKTLAVVSMAVIFPLLSALLWMWLVRPLAPFSGRSGASIR